MADPIEFRLSAPTTSARMLVGKADPVQNSVKGRSKAREAAALAAGVSRGNVSKVEKIIEKATPM